MFISMWISNTAATAMMIPIMETVLIELEAVSFQFLFQKTRREIIIQIFASARTREHVRPERGSD